MHSRPEFPKWRPDLLWREIDNEIVVYDPTVDQLIMLNLSGGVAMQLCDGSRSVGQIVLAVAEHFDVPAEDIEEDVCRLLDELCTKGLFEPGSGHPSPRSDT